MEGESGRNELLRGPFALFGVRISAKLVRNLAKHRRTPMSPPQLIPPTSPVQVFLGDERLRRRFSRPRSVSAADCLQPQRGRGPCRCHYAYGCVEWQRQGPPPHLTRETFSGRRSADWADTPGGVFRPGDHLSLGRRRSYSLRSTFSLGGMHRAAKLDRTSPISDGFQRHPQTIASPPSQ